MQCRKNECQHIYLIVAVPLAVLIWFLYKYIKIYKYIKENLFINLGWDKD